MDSKEQRSALRGAVYRGDGSTVVELLRGAGADVDSLQLAGDGLIAAVMQRVDGAAELARDLVVGLRQRGWDGCSPPPKSLTPPRPPLSDKRDRAARRCGAAEIVRYR